MDRFTSTALMAAALVFTASSSQAAVTVIGSGLSHTCYEAAEYATNTTEGIAACTEALEEAALPTRDRAATYINRGILYSVSGDAETAIKDYNQGLALEPKLGEGYVDRGAAFIVLKQYDDAIENIDKGIALNANRLHIAYYDRAIANEALGNIRAAYEDCKKAVELQPNFTLAVERLSRFKVIRRPGTGT